MLADHNMKHDRGTYLSPIHKKKNSELHQVLCLSNDPCKLEFPKENYWEWKANQRKSPVRNRILSDFDLFKLRRFQNTSDSKGKTEDNCLRKRVINGGYVNCHLSVVSVSAYNQFIGI